MWASFITDTIGFSALCQERPFRPSQPNAALGKEQPLCRSLMGFPILHLRIVRKRLG